MQVITAVKVEGMTYEERLRNAQESAERRAIRVQTALIAIMIGSSLYAPYAAYSWIFWGISSVCLELLYTMGVDWQHLWRDATFKVMAW